MARKGINHGQECKGAAEEAWVEECFARSRELSSFRGELGDRLQRAND